MSTPLHAPHPPPGPGAPARSAKILRGINATVVLRAVRQHEPLSRAEVARRTGLSRPTVNEVMEQLLDAGFVREVEAPEDPEPRRPGRPGRLLAFQADVGYVLGIDIGGTKIRALLSDLNGNILASERRVPPVGDAKRTLSAVRWTASSVLRKAGLPRTALRAVGAATPGVIDPVSGAVTLAPQLAGWDGTHLLNELQRSFECPVVVEGEVRAGLIGESAWGLAQGRSNVAYIYLGTGIGSAFMIDGRIYRGTRGAAGEIGFLPVGPPVPKDTPPGYGAFEYAAGGLAFARLGSRRAEDGEQGEAIRQAAGHSGKVDARAVFTAASQGDPAARRIVARIGREIAKGIASVALVLDPELIILGGGLSLTGPLLREPIANALEKLIPHAPEIATSALGPDGVALGVLRLGLDLVDEELFNFELRPLSKSAPPGAGGGSHVIAG